MKMVKEDYFTEILAIVGFGTIVYYFIGTVLRVATNGYTELGISIMSLTLYFFLLMKILRIYEKARGKKMLEEYKNYFVLIVILFGFLLIMLGVFYDLFQVIL